MPVFNFSFRDASGAIQKKTAEADSEEVLRSRYEEQGLEILDFVRV
jgi:type IV pilus assembly protein PilC